MIKYIYHILERLVAMNIDLKYSMRINYKYPLVEVIGELIKIGKNEDALLKLMQAALIAIDKAEACNGKLLNREFLPERKRNGNYVWFTVAFKSFEDVSDYMNRMSYLE